MLVMSAMPASAAPPLSSPDQAFLTRMSLADAHSSLVEAVLALPLKDGATIGTWLAGNVALDRALRLELRSRPCHGPVRIYGDGTAEADLMIPPDEVVELLVTLQQKYAPPRQQALTQRTLHAAARQWPFVWSTGVAALDERVDDSAKPEGWQDVAPEGLELARRAATADALQALLDSAAQLKITSARRLAEFLDHGREIRQAVLAGLADTATQSVSLDPDQVATATAEIRVPDLIRILSEVHRDHYDGHEFHAADFREMALLVNATTISATGLATPPPRHILRSAYESRELDVPRWADGLVRATGRYVPSVAVADPPMDARIQAARYDGMDRLRQQVVKLVIRNGVTIEAFLAERPELKEDVVMFLTAARMVAVAEPTPDGVIAVRVELPMRRLWEIVKRGMRRIEVDPPEAAVDQPTPDAEVQP